MQTEVRSYQVIEAVGRGGFGTVYRAEMLGPGGFRKTVALKVLNPEVADHHDFAERLRDEARMLGLLRHRAIVQVDGLLILNGRWTVVMEYVEGVDLKAILQRGNLPIGATLEIVQEVAGALHSAYDTPTAEAQPIRLLHRDIKPSNVHLTAAGEVKVLDFGVARAEFQQRESVTRSIFFGSLGYMSPERLDGIDTHKGDVYALGAVFFELLLGEPLGRTSGNRERHEAHVKEALARLQEAVLDEELVVMVGQCLAYDEGARPTARDLERQIRSLKMRYAEPWLKDWSELVVPEAMASRERIRDDLSGSILVEQARVSGSFPAGDDSGADSQGVPAAPNRHGESGGGRVWVGVLAAVLAAVLVFFVGGGAVGGLWLALKGESEEAVPAGPSPRHDATAIDALADEGTTAESAGVESTGTDPPDVNPPVGADERSPPAPAAAGTSSTETSGQTVPKSETARTSSVEQTPAGETRGSSTEADPSKAPASGNSTTSGSSQGSTTTGSGTGTSGTGTSSGGVSPWGTTSSGASASSRQPTAPPSTGARGTVRVSGEAVDVRLVGNGGSYPAGVVPAGRYDVWAVFDAGSAAVKAGNVTVVDGRQLAVSCRARLKRCTSQ